MKKSSLIALLFFVLSSCNTTTEKKVAQKPVQATTKTTAKSPSIKVIDTDFSKKSLNPNPKNDFTVTFVTDFEWKPILKNDYLKTDILNKDKVPCAN